MFPFVWLIGEVRQPQNGMRSAHLCIRLLSDDGLHFYVTRHKDLILLINPHTYKTLCYLLTKQFAIIASERTTTFCVAFQRCLALPATRQRADIEQCL